MATQQEENLINLLDGYVEKGGHHLNVNVFGVDPSLPQMEAALKGIECLEDFLFNKLGLKSTLTEIGIDDKNIDVMAKKACNGKETLNGWKVLTPAQIAEILRACL